MKKYFLSVIFILCLTACSFPPINFTIDGENSGKGKIIDKSYTVSFTRVEQQNGIESDVFLSNENKVIVNAPEDIIDKIVVEKKDSATVWIYVKKYSNISTDKVKVKIYTNALESIETSSASSVDVVDSFVSPQLRLSSSSGSKISGNFKSLNAVLHTSSGSNIDITLYSKHLEAQSSSGSTIEIKGIAQNAVLEASSGSRIDSEDLLISDAQTETSSGGTIEISVTQKAIAKASTGGHIDLYRKGNNFELNKKETSGGEVNIK